MPTPDKITDFVSGKEVRGTPEELQAVQPFTRALVEDYGYPKSLIRSHPQWRVRARPSDVKREYPVDICVFKSEEHKDGDEYIVVECKKTSRQDGRNQLQDYLRFCSAELGVWFNGAERLFLRKVERDGRVEFHEIPNIPRYGERIEDIGRFNRSDLTPAKNLKQVFKAIRNYWAANAVGITLDERFAQQLINIIFCKIYDERFTRPDALVKFRAGLNEPMEDVSKRVRNLFEHVKTQYSDVIEKDDTILIDDQSLAYFVGEIQQYALTESERDSIADAFEVFISNSLKGPQGQFFTPRNVARLLVDLVNPQIGERVIDPACGSGGFLIETLRHFWTLVDLQAESLKWPESEAYAEKQRVAIRGIRGVDKDSFLAKTAKAYMAILGDGRGGVFCENSLESMAKWQRKAKDEIKAESFSVVVTNPPFGKKLKITDQALLKQYDLGHKWKKDKENGTLVKTQKIQDSQPPQILFVERCLQLLEDGGRLGIVVPESMFCNPSHRYIVEYIRKNAKIRAIISMPEDLFQPYTHAKTCLAVIEKNCESGESSDSDIFMAQAMWCGHDSRGLEIPNDDLPEIQARYDKYRDEGKLAYDHLGFAIPESEIINNIYLPKYYNPEISQKLNKLRRTHELISLGELIDNGVVAISTGDEVGKLSYGTGDIPFIRTSDLANWEIKADPKQGLSEAIYNEYALKQDVQEHDILMVRDGTYLVGTCAMITKLDTRIVFQSHIYKIRSNDHDNFHPFLLIAALSSPIVTEQIYAKRFTQDIIDSLGDRYRAIACNSSLANWAG